MKQRELLYSTEARERLKKGIDTLANMVKVTLGPKGNNVIIERTSGLPLITKDGVTVAKEIFLKDSVENMGAQLVKEVASRTNEVAGDGTTTATVLTQAFINEGIKSITAGVNPMDLKRGMDIAVKEIVYQLKNISKNVTGKQDIVHVASISANNDYQVGDIIANAIEAAGNEGIVIVEENKGVETEIDSVEGMQFDRGYKFPIYVNKKQTMEVELQNVYILVYNSTLSQLPILASLMEQIVKKGNSSLLVIADEFSDEVNKLLVLNSAKGIIRCCSVQSPGFGDRRSDILHDIVSFTGGVVFDNDNPLTQASLSLLGRADKVIVSKNKTIIVEGEGDFEKVRERVDLIRYQMEEASTEFDRQKLQERLGRLTGGIVVLRVGAMSETELGEKKMRIEDALHATRAALEEGIVPGGGVALVRVRESIKDSSKLQYIKGNIDDQKAGVLLIYKSLVIPFLSICSNAGLSSETILRDIEKEESLYYGYNVLNDTYGDLYEMGVIDPTKVVRSALENASSVSSMFLLTEGVIFQSKEEKDYINEMLSQASKY